MNPSFFVLNILSKPRILQNGEQDFRWNTERLCQRFRPTFWAASRINTKRKGLSWNIISHAFILASQQPTSPNLEKATSCLKISERCHTPITLLI